jgi:hypothetical protein
VAQGHQEVLMNLKVLLAALMIIFAAAGSEIAHGSPKPVATSDYICTPSGYGHQAECHLKR